MQIEWAGVRERERVGAERGDVVELEGWTLYRDYMHTAKRHGARDRCHDAVASLITEWAECFQFQLACISQLLGDSISRVGNEDISIDDERSDGSYRIPSIAAGRQVRNASSPTDRQD